MVFFEHVKIREEKFGAVIFETLREKVFITNKTGKDILNLLGKGCPVDKIIDILANSYNIQPSAIKEDINSFINQLKDNNILINSSNPITQATQ